MTQNDNTENRPVRPLRTKVKVEKSGDLLRLSYCHREWGGGIFMLLWLIGWTVGCVALAGELIKKPQFGLFIFAIPFWSSWLFVFFLVLKMFFQKEVFGLDSAGATFVRRVFVALNRRETPLEEIKTFLATEEVTESENGSRTAFGVSMETLGMPLEFLEGIPQAESRWLQYLLELQLVDLRERFHVEPPVDVDETDAEAEESSEESIERSDTLSDGEPAEPPSDCTWQREDDFDSVKFCQPGRLSLAVLGGLLFVNAFWNGIVSVFICVLLGIMDDKKAIQGGEWWGLFFFLIPFEVIGLIMLFGLIFVLLEPLRRTTWRIGRSDISCRLTWFGLGPTWRYPINVLDRIEIGAKESAGVSGKNRITLPWKSSEAAFRLSFIDTSEREVCAIDSLTEGEACWIFDVICRERPNWFQ